MAVARPVVTVVGSYAVGMTLRTDRIPVTGETRIGSDFDLGPGGKGSNQAIQAARLGADVELLTCVGFATRELPADHPVRDDVEEIGRAADRAAALTRQLLMFSRREVVKPEVLDVGGLLRDLERLLNRTVSERIALRITVGPWPVMQTLLNALDEVLVCA